MGLKSLKPEALAGLVPLFLPISLLSTAYVPRDLLPGWVQVARPSTPTPTVEGVRDLMTGRAEFTSFAAAFAAALTVVAATQLAAARRFARLVAAD